MPGSVRAFILSPANLSGPRAEQLLREGGRSHLARRLREEGSAPIGEVCRYVSGLYFRGKLEYAQAFARSHESGCGVYVIVPGLGLRAPPTLVDRSTLRRIAGVEVAPDDPRYAEPLRADGTRIAAGLPLGAEVVFLGSLASPKYVPFLREAFGTRLTVPEELVGLGMMQRGALLRRRALEGRELSYMRLSDGLA